MEIALVEAAATGDPAAWGTFWATVEPELQAIIARPSFLGRLGQRDDDRDNIALAVMSRLRTRLHRFLEARRTNPALEFSSWLRVVAKRCGIDYMRAHPDYRRRERTWAVPKTLPPPSQLGGERPPMTDRGTARELLALATRDHRRALELWAHGESFATIAHVLNLDSELAAHRLVRAAIERLRRYYRETA
ncbi:MAG: hypothetical protein QM831_37245 [Kofleriaceae bacterium]